MDNSNITGRQPLPRRKRPSKIAIFKEAYLPAVIAGAALICILVFIIGSISLNVQKNKAETEASIQASISQAEEDAKTTQQVQNLLAEAAIPAAGFDFDGAIAILNTFNGDRSKYPEIDARIADYESEKGKLVPWNDPKQIPNLSLQLLIADPARAYKHTVYQDSFNRNFITTDEFSAILQQLYDNGYILVNLEDIVTTAQLENGDTVYKSKTIYLPADKKPIMLTQTNVNYSIYLVDGDGDNLPDKFGCGFAHKLLLDDNGEFTCEMVNANGETQTGAFDMVPILEAFIKEHPDFSYQNARAILALTGFNGLFGYRTQEDAKETFGDEAYEVAVKDARAVADALKNRGYTLACYTYENTAYGEISATQIQSDLNDWNNEVTPIIGNTDILVYAQLSDISTEEVYEGDKYNMLQNYGFRYYLGFSDSGAPWITIADACVRQGRTMLTGYNLTANGSWFANMFDPAQVLDRTRPAM